MNLRRYFAAAAAACFLFTAYPIFAKGEEPAYRILAGVRACLPCDGASYVVIDSPERVQSLHADLQVRCGASHAAEQWRESIDTLGIDFRHEALVAMYEVIGTAGKPSLAITDAGRGVLKAAIDWHTGPPPHVPIASAVCLTFAVRKSLVQRVEIMKGGVLNQGNRTLSLPVLQGGPARQ